MNTAILEGFLGRDVEVRYMQDGRAVANLSLATSEKRGENVYTEWHRIVVFSKIAEKMAAIYKKGRQVLVTGRLHTRKWEQEGVARYTTEIVVDSYGHTVKLLGAPPKVEKTDRIAEAQKKNQAAINQAAMSDEPFVPPMDANYIPEYIEDDIPF